MPSTPRTSSSRMVDVKAWGWMLLPLCMVALAGRGPRSSSLAEGACDHYVDITYLESAVAKGAVCLDGSAPAYHFSPGFGTGVNNWLVHLEGGGWCNDVSSCLSRKSTYLGSSKAMDKQAQFAGMLSKDQQCNPDFYNWNKVKVRYCDGSSFTGDVEEVDPSTDLHYRGQRIFAAVMEDLLAKGMNGAQNALLSGCSAGGLASMLHCDSFRSLLPSGARAKCLADAGFFIDLMGIDGKESIKSFYNGVASLHGSAKNLPQSCTSTMNPNTCFFPQYVAWRLQTPLFILNPAYDSWQISNILVPYSADPSGTWKACKTDIRQCTPSQLKTLQTNRKGSWRLVLRSECLPEDRLMCLSLQPDVSQVLHLQCLRAVAYFNVLPCARITVAQYYSIATYAWKKKKKKKKKKCIDRCSWGQREATPINYLKRKHAWEPDRDL